MLSTLTVLMAGALAAPLAPPAVVAYRAELVYTGVDDEPIKDGVVIVEGGNITAVGPAAEVAIPEGAAVFTDAVLTPGLIDTWATAGLTGPHNRPFDQDHAEPDAPVHPELRAVDGYNPTDRLVAWVASFGVTTMMVGPSPGHPVGGQPVVVSTLADHAIPVFPDARPFQVFTLGEPAKWRFGDAGAHSRMGGAAIIRQAFIDAQEYKARRALPGADRAPRDLGMDALVEVLDGARTPVFHADRATDIGTALRLIDEFGLDHGDRWSAVIAGGAEGWLAAELLHWWSGQPPFVMVGPVMSRSWRPGDQRNSNFENAAKLTEAGATVTFMSGYEGYVPKVRVVLWEAAVAAANGHGRAGALRSLTIDAARLLGIDAVTGSLEVGKRGDLVLFDGDPFEVTSHACRVVVAGIPVSETCH